MEWLHRCDEKVATRKSSAQRSDKGCAPGRRVGSRRSSQAAAAVAAAPSPRVHAANRGRDTEASAVLRPTSGRRSRCANLPFCATPALSVSPPMVQRSAFRADEPARFIQGGHPDGSASSWVERELFPLYSCLNQQQYGCGRIRWHGGFGIVRETVSRHGEERARERDDSRGRSPMRQIC